MFSSISMGVFLLVEDAIDEALGSDGDVTGAGTGENGSNLDLFVEDDALADDKVVGLIQDALRPFTIPDNSEIVIGTKEYSTV